MYRYHALTCLSPNGQVRSSHGKQNETKNRKNNKIKLSDLTNFFVFCCFIKLQLVLDG